MISISQRNNYLLSQQAMLFLCTFLLLMVQSSAYAQTKTAKKLYLPANIWMVPKGNDFNDDQQEFSYKRMAESENIAIFWSKSYGADLAIAPDSNSRLNIQQVLKECERFYSFYVDSLAFVEKGKSVTDQYKLLIFIFGGKDNTAYGGGEEKVGIVWTPLSRMKALPYGALAHEIGHSFQYLVHADGAWAFTSSAPGSGGQPIFEMSSQYMLWHVYPEWMTFENYHLKSYLQKTNFAFLHETNQYHSPYVLEYWSTKHGLKFIGKLWQKAEKGEDPVMTYKRITDINQKQFNDEMHQAAARFITWDLDQAKKAMKSYANQHQTTLRPVENGWYNIDSGACPQNYGYNGIQLRVPPEKTSIKLEFKGLVGENGFRKINSESAGWRYSFLAVKKNGQRVYGKINDAQIGTVNFKIPKDTEYLWLIVSGAPTRHWEHLSDGKSENDEQWPYQIKITGTDLLL